jgi:hypothetical protein
LSEDSSSNGEKEKKDLSLIQCFKCKELGHYSTLKTCPMNKKQDVENTQDKTTFATATWQREQEVGMFLMQEVLEEHVINNVTQVQGLLPTEIYRNFVRSCSKCKHYESKSVKKCETCGEKDQSERSRWCTNGSGACR